jgi:hypothetical protein
MAEIETKEPQAGTGNQGVQLGIGTLIIIALIVTMCSGRSEMEKIQKDTTELKKQLGAIEQKLDALAPHSSENATSGQDATVSQDSVEAPAQNP